MKRHWIWALALGIVVVTAGLGFRLTSTLAPQRLEQTVRQFLVDATGEPVEIAKLRLVLGFPIQIEADGLSLWGGALFVERANARLDPGSVVAGRPRLNRLRLEGAHLSVARVPEGDGYVWSPPIADGTVEDPDEPSLAPLRFLEDTVRGLLEAPLLADTLVVRRSRVTLAPAPGEDRPPTELFRVNGRLLHSHLFGDARFFLQLTPGASDGSRGSIEWTGTRDPSGLFTLGMATSELDLSLAEPYLRSMRSTASLEGRLDAVAQFTTEAEGTADITVDAVVRDALASLPDETGEAKPWRSRQVSVRLGLGVREDRLEISKARIAMDPLVFRLDANLERPVDDGARAQVSIGVADLAANVETARTLSEWLDPDARDAVRSVTDRIESGRIVKARLSGAADVSRWRKALGGRLESLPRSFRLEVALDDVALKAGPESRIEGLEGEFTLARDNFSARGVRGDLDGAPLPQLDVTLSGFREMLMALPPTTDLASSAKALVGATPLFEKFRPEDDDPHTPPPPIAVRIDHLNHPALLWPVVGVNLDLLLAPDDDGLQATISDCRWAGVILDGDIDWAVVPDRRMAIELSARKDPDASPLPDPSPILANAGDAWARGSFEIGPSTGPRWRQRSAVGTFSASGGSVALRDVVIELDPAGRLAGQVDLDLARPEAAFYTLDAKLRDADAAALVGQLGAETEIFSGVIAIDAALRGSVVPERPLLHDADGKLGITAREGTIQRALPPLFAIAMAGESLNPFASSDAIRYRKAQGYFDLVKGRISTDRLDIDGPDVRMFASGNVDLSSPPYALDAELALFLFRQIDWALGKIPILNALLLGEHENLVAAYFRLVGSWQEPDARMQPLRTLEKGPVDVLTKGIPRVVQQGVKAIGGVFTRPEDGAGGPSEDGTPPGDAASEVSPSSNLEGADPS